MRPSPSKKVVNPTPEQATEATEKKEEENANKSE
jgi:hypothetical protein